jgi:nucleoside-diphosphate-sugar epimerase
MTKLLITGGTGFIGVPLVKKLHEKGHNLKILVRETSNVEPFQGLNNIEYVYGDIQDLDVLQKSIDGVDSIYHLAAYTRQWARDKNTWEKTNVVGTDNIARVALEKKKKFIYMSSFVAIGPNPDDFEEPADESYEDPDHFHLDYEKTKYKAKHLVKDYINKGLNATCFYPGVVYGPGDFNIFGEMLYDIVRGKFLGLPGDGQSYACWTYLDDVIDCLASVVDRDDINGEDFFLGGENQKFLDYLNLIAEIAEVKKPRRFPMWAAKLYALLCELKSKITKKMPYITRKTLATLNYHRAYSSKKAIEKLGYKITPLREGLTKTIKWYQGYIQSQKK